MSWVVRIWFKGCDGPPQKVRLKDYLARQDIYVHNGQDGWTWLMVQGKMLQKYHAALEEWEVVKA